MQQWLRPFGISGYTGAGLCLHLTRGREAANTGDSSQISPQEEAAVSHIENSTQSQKKEVRGLDKGIYRN